jgi:hypothetical protein
MEAFHREDHLETVQEAPLPQPLLRDQVLALDYTRRVRVEGVRRTSNLKEFYQSIMSHLRDTLQHRFAMRRGTLRGRTERETSYYGSRPSNFRNSVQMFSTNFCEDNKVAEERPMVRQIQEYRHIFYQKILFIRNEIKPVKSSLLYRLQDFATLQQMFSMSWNAGSHVLLGGT